MRMGLENPVAVYSLSAVRPGRPQSHVGPVARRRARPQSSQNSAGSAGEQHQHGGDAHGRNGAAARAFPR